MRQAQKDSDDEEVLKPDVSRAEEEEASSFSESVEIPQTPLAKHMRNREAQALAHGGPRLLFGRVRPGGSRQHDSIYCRLKMRQKRAQPGTACAPLPTESCCGVGQGTTCRTLRVASAVDIQSVQGYLQKLGSCDHCQCSTDQVGHTFSFIIITHISSDLTVS